MVFYFYYFFSFFFVDFYEKSVIKGIGFFVFGYYYGVYFLQFVYIGYFRSRCGFCMWSWCSEFDEWFICEN